jgi:regulator of protease activity HflC (stomatin/prohibitin superfamily)
MANKAERFQQSVQFRWRRFWPIFAILVVTLVTWNSCTSYVRPGQWGVKQVVFGSGQGVHQEIYPPGTHFMLPGVERMHLFPAVLQVLEMSDSQLPSAHIPNLRTVPAIKIQTSEGYTVSVDITVLYRIEDAYKVMTKIGPNRLYEDAVVVPRAEQQLRRTFGELDAEEFYKGDTREKAANDAQRLLGEELQPLGIKVTHVLVRQYRYDVRYQAAIEQRKIQDQTVFKNQAEAQAATAEAEKNKIVAEGQAAVQVEYARGNAEVEKLKSEADLYTRTKAAEGELTERLAQAQGTDLQNKALRGAGSENMVGLKMADALKGVDVVVLPSDGEGGTNPLDLNQMLKRFDVRGQ